MTRTYNSSFQRGTQEGNAEECARNSSAESKASAEGSATASHVEDDWGLACDFFLFAQHQAESVWVAGKAPSLQLEILCVESLTPLDMVQLGSGIHDGMYLWFVFVEETRIEKTKSIHFQQQGTAVGLPASCGLQLWR